MLDAAADIAVGPSSEDQAQTPRDPSAIFQAREFSLVGAFRKRYGDEAIALAKHANYEAGYRAGLQAIAAFKPEKRDLPTAVAMKDRWTGGKPASEVSDTEAIYRNDAICGKWALWKQAGLPIAVGCDYNGAWSEGFMQAINPGIRHVRKSWRALGDQICEEVFELIGS
jgi:hypothetical protein